MAQAKVRYLFNVISVIESIIMIQNVYMQMNNVMFNNMIANLENFTSDESDVSDRYEFFLITLDYVTNGCENKESSEMDEEVYLEGEILNAPNELWKDEKEN